MDIHDWIAVFGIVSTIVGVLLGGGGIYAYLRLRAEVSKINAETRQTEAQAKNTDALTVEVQARSWSMLVESQGERIVRLTTRVEQLEGQLKQRDIESEARDRRIKELQDQLEEKDGVIEKQRERLSTLEVKVQELEIELEEYKSGRKVKTKTGPLFGRQAAQEKGTSHDQSPNV